MQIQLTHVDTCIFLFSFLISLKYVILKHLLGYSHSLIEMLTSFHYDQAYQVNLHFSILGNISPKSLCFLFQPRLMIKEYYIAVILGG